MSKKGGGAKGDKGGGKGGKGGPKGGKGPPADPLMECAAEDDWTGELAGDEDPASEEWFFDSAIGSVRAEPQPQQAEQGLRSCHNAVVPRTSQGGTP